MNKMKNLLNNRGEEVVVDLIPDIDLKRHILVEKIFAKVEKFRKQGEKLSSDIDKEIRKYILWIGKKSKVSGDNDFIGGLTLNNYSQTKQIRIASAETVSFDERLNIAKAKIDKCLKKWSEESNNSKQAIFLSAIAKEAFQVDKKGLINKAQIIKLVKIKIDDSEWIEAQQLIQDSMQIERNKSYKNFKKRTNAKEDWETINLNFSSF